MTNLPLPILWSTHAVADLRGITNYIRTHSPTAARRIRRQLRDATARLSQFPLSGRLVPELENEAYREIIVRDYRIIYRVLPDHIRVLTVVHGARDLPSLLPLDEP